MSATVGSRGSQKYVDFDEFIEFQVNRTRAGIRHTDLLIAVMFAALVVAAYLLAFVVLDQWIVDGGFAYWTRVAMLVALLTFLLVWSGWKIALPYWRRVSALYAARELEQVQPELKSNLLTLVDLKRAGRPVPPHIRAALEKRAALRLSQTDVEQAVDRRPLMRLAYGLFAIVLVFCLYTVLSPKPVGASILRALLPVADVGVATRTRIVKVDPGDATVLARSQLEVTVDLAGEIPPEATLLLTTRDRSLVDEPMILRDTGEGLNRFRGILAGPNGRGLLQDFTYRIVAGDAQSETYKVTVNQAPYATVESVTYEYPAYMGLNPKQQTGGEIDAWEGTRVTVRASSNMPVAAATLMMHDSEDTSLKGEELNMRLLDETHFEATWTLQFRSDGTYPHYYRIDLRTADGQRDPVPRLYSLTIRRDVPPEIQLLHPSGDVELPANARLPVAFKARDPDFMLRSVRMYFEHRDQVLDAKTRHLYDAPPYRSQLEGRSEIDLSKFGLQPGEVLTFWLEAWDNMQPLGERTGNRSVTPRINISIVDPVSPDEVEQRREEEEQRAQEKLEEARDQSTGEQDATQEPVEGTEPEPQQETADEAQPASEAEPGAGAESEANSQEGQPQAGKSDAAGSEGSTGDGSTEPAGEGEPQTGEEQTGGEQSAQDASETQPGGASTEHSGEQQADEAPSEKSPGQPGTPQRGQGAADDEALQKIFERYRDQIEQQRRQEQQNPDARPQDQTNSGRRAGEDSASGEQAEGGERPQSGTQSESSSNQPSGDSQSRDLEQAGDSGDLEGSDEPGGEKRTEQMSRQDGGQNDPSQQTESGSQDGTSPGAEEQPSAEQPSADQNSTGDQPQPEAAGRDPQTNQDPRAEESRPQGSGDSAANKSKSGEQSDASDPAAPRTGDTPATDPGQNSKPQKSESSRTDSRGNPSEQAPSAGESGSDAAEARPRDPMPSEQDTPGDAGQSDAQQRPDGRRARTGDQPSGPDDSQPGQGRPDGQRSEQPSGGERGSSQQASEGMSGGDQQGPGETTDSPGSQTEGAGGRPSGGDGQPSNSGGQQSSEGEGSQGGSESSDGASPRPGSDAKMQSDTQDGAQDAGQPQDGAPSDRNATDGQNKQRPDASEGDPMSGGSDEAQPQDGRPQGDASQGGKPSGMGDGQSGGEQQGGDQQGGGQQGGEQAGGNQSGEGQSGNQAGAGQQGGRSGDRSASGTGNGSDGAAPSSAGAGGSGSGGEGAEPAELSDKKRATELVLKRLQDELSRGEVSQELLQDLGWTEENLRDFMERLDQRLSDTGEDQSPEARQRRQQFLEILRGIDYSSEGRQRAATPGERSAQGGTGVIPRRPAPSEFRDAEEAFKQRLSRQTRAR